MRFSLSRAYSRTQSLEVFPFPTTTTSTAATTITASRRISPVEIPELLEIIFSYIDNYTLRMCVVRVCRQWFLMNRQRVVREVIWDNGADLSVKKPSCRACWAPGGYGGTLDGIQPWSGRERIGGKPLSRHLRKIMSVI